jgi:hypothetical protein
LAIGIEAQLIGNCNWLEDAEAFASEGRGIEGGIGIEGLVQDLGVLDALDGEGAGVFGFVAVGDDVDAAGGKPRTVGIDHARFWALAGGGVVDAHALLLFDGFVDGFQLGALFAVVAAAEQSRQLCNGPLHNSRIGPRACESSHILQISRGKSAHLGKRGLQILGQMIDDSRAPALVCLSIENHPSGWTGPVRSRQGGHGPWCSS